MTKYLDSDGLAHLWEKLKSFFVAQSKIANNATTTESGFVLDARTGKVLADQITELNAQINSLNTSLANKLYPVGSIYISVNATNPAELFGGAWEQIKGRFLLGVGSNDANTTDWWGTVQPGSVNVPAGELGGEAKHILSAAEMPSHAHTVRIWDPQGTVGGAQGAYAVTYGATLITVPYGATTPLTWNNSTPMVADNGMGDPAGVTEFSGGGKQHNNMPPYLGVYMWKRTA